MTRAHRGDPDHWVSAFYLPGGEFAAALSQARGWAAKTRVWLSFTKHLRFTPIYLLILATVTMVLNHVVSEQTRQQVIAANSTNVANLHDHQVWTLVTSAFVVEGQLHLVALPGLVLLLGAAELLWGWRRLTAVFFLGKAVASCLVYGLLLGGVRNGLIQPAVTVASDVGYSYATLAVSGAIIFSLPVRSRRLFVAIALVAVVPPLLVGRTFTDLGHLLSVLVGFAVGWQLRRRPLAARLGNAVPHPDAIETAYVFDRPARAWAALVSALHLQEHHQIGLHDAVVTWRETSSRVRARESRDMRALDGAFAGGAFGVVAGTVVNLPFAGLIVGAVLGAVMASLHDSGLSDGAIAAAGRTLSPRRAALLLLVEPADLPLVETSFVELDGVRADAQAQYGPS